MRSHFLILLILLGSVLASCCSESPCQINKLNTFMVSYTTSDIDTIIVRRFTKSNNFQNQIDTILITKFNSRQDVIRPDTTAINIYGSAKFQLEPGYDFEIFVPATTTFVRVSDIIEEKQEKRYCFVSDGQHPCYNPIISFKLNGQLISGENIFIKK